MVEIDAILKYTAGFLFVPDWPKRYSLPFCTAHIRRRQKYLINLLFNIVRSSFSSIIYRTIGQHAISAHCDNMHASTGSSHHALSTTLPPYLFYMLQHCSKSATSSRWGVERRSSCKQAHRQSIYASNELTSELAPLSFHLSPSSPPITLQSSQHRSVRSVVAVEQLRSTSASNWTGLATIQHLRPFLRRWAGRHAGQSVGQPTGVVSERAAGSV